MGITDPATFRHTQRHSLIRMHANYGVNHCDIWILIHIDTGCGALRRSGYGIIKRDYKRPATNLLKRRVAIAFLHLRKGAPEISYGALGRKWMACDSRIALADPPIRRACKDGSHTVDLGLRQASDVLQVLEQNIVPVRQRLRGCACVDKHTNGKCHL